MTTLRAVRLPLSLCLAAAACAGLRPARPDEVRPQEYAVYRAVLDGDLLRAASDQLVVSDTAGIPPAMPEIAGGDELLGLGVPAAVAQDFRARNASPAPLREGAFGTRLPVRVMPRARVDSIFRRGSGDGWGMFYTVYRGSSGMIRLSRVGFSPDGTEAVLSVDHACGLLCGKGQLVWLRRSEGRWQVVRSRIRWMS